ncbi:MAG: hypothetical protein NUV65_05920 [Candidatus Roizmanbacteria bacterium]|nr:hypothetical protein [Candidatus Roizmanbacteria bacterium]
MATTKLKLSIQATVDADIAFNSHKITGLLDPTAAQDGATKNYVDSVAQGLSVKDSCRAATTANITIAAPGASIDGVTLATNDRVLVKNQTTAAENGIYQFNGAAEALTRTTDADSWAELVSAFTFVEEGTNADSGWVCTANSGGTLGSTAITFTQFSGAGEYIWGDGLTNSTNTISVVVDNTTIEISTDALRIKAGGITDSHINASAGIADTKLATIATANKVSGSAVQLAATTALENSTGLRLKAATAGNGLTITNQVLAVGAGTGISVGADAVSIDTDAVLLHANFVREVFTTFATDLYPLASSPAKSQYLFVFLNGLFLSETDDYTLDGSNLTILAGAFIQGVKLVVYYVKA